MRALQNKVIVEITKHNKGEVSESTGIIKLSPTALIENPNADDGMISSTHLDRYGIVRATTSDYKFRKNNSDYSWEPASVETEVGDEVLFDYIDSKNTPTWEFEGKEFKTFDYSQIRVIRKPDGRIVMPNGYVILEIPILQKESTILCTPEVIDKWHGFVLFSGLPNKRYLDKSVSDIEEELPEKTKVRIKTNYIRYPESKYHAKFWPGKQYRIIQRHEILCIV